MFDFFNGLVDKFGVLGTIGICVVVFLLIVAVLKGFFGKRPSDVVNNVKNIKNKSGNSSGGNNNNPPPPPPPPQA